jgi:hypothetical protein
MNEPLLPPLSLPTRTHRLDDARKQGDANNGKHVVDQQQDHQEAGECRQKACHGAQHLQQGNNA